MVVPIFRRLADKNKKSNTIIELFRSELGRDRKPIDLIIAIVYANSNTIINRTTKMMHQKPTAKTLKSHQQCYRKKKKMLFRHENDTKNDFKFM